MKASGDIAREIVLAAQAVGIELWTEGGKLRFRGPKGALTPDLRDRLKNHKTELIEYLSREGAPSAAAALRTTIPRADRAARIPLSRSQLRLWFIDRLNPGRPHYNEVLAGRIFGALDIAAMRRATDLLSQRHEILRTTFVAVDGEPAQHIHDFMPPSFEEHDLRDWPERLREKELHRLITRLSMQPFELDRGPLHRVHIIRLGSEEFILLHVLHHIICDAWSTLLYLREFAEAYSAICHGAAPRFEELPIQFADYAVWLERRMQRGDFDAQLSFWRRELEGLPPLMPMPLDFARSQAVSDATGESVDFILDTDVRSGVQDLARSRQATPFMVLLSMWGAYLRLWSGAEDFALGTPVANRGLPELQKQVGFFVNTLALRMRVQDDPDITTLVDRVRVSTLMAMRNQDVPFDRLVAELASNRDDAHTPIFQVMFIYEEEAPKEQLVDNLRLELYPFKLPAAKFDLSLVVVPLDGGYRCFLEYDRSLIVPEHAEQIAADFSAFVRAALAAPTKPLTRIDFGDADRKAALRAVLNGAIQELPADASIVSLFLQQVENTPDATALRIANQVLGYAELNSRANRIAHLLQTACVGADQVVALALEGGADVVIAALGVLKAGAAYMPLDPGYPKARRDIMLRRAAVRAVICLRATAFETDLPLIVLDELPDTLPDGEPGVAVHPQSCANVIFTSGSTGEPKGVAVTHGNVVRFVLDRRMADVRPDDVFLQFAAPAFDLSTFEMWTPLCHGASLACPPRQDHSLENLGRLIRLHGVSILWLTAGLYHAAIDEALPELLSLRRLLAGGEALAPDKTAQLRARFEGDLVDGYGPTENCVFTSMYSVPRGFDGSHSVPIGTPLDNSPLHVLGEDLWPVSPGVTGELYAAGAGVARGYVGRPALTAERFVPDPFSARPGARMYRTGDRVRQQRDGKLEFQGRADRQIKLRGFRIEPADIELQLRRHPDIAQVHVAVPDDARQLAAWFVTREDFKGDETQLLLSLRDFAAEKLPSYMQPAAWLRLARMPLTANGKLDQRALPRAFTAMKSDGSRPANKLEEVLHEIWRDLLGREDFGVETSFFALGGHSLKAMQMATRIQRRGIGGFTVRMLFDFPSIRLLADRLREEANNKRMFSAADTTSGPSCTMPLSPAQRDLLRHIRDFSASALPPFILLRLQQPADPGRILTALKTLFARRSGLNYTIVESAENEAVLQSHPDYVPRLTVISSRTAVDPQAFPAARLRATHSDPIAAAPAAADLLIHGDEAPLLLLRFNPLLLTREELPEVFREFCSAFEEAATHTAEIADFDIAHLEWPCPAAPSRPGADLALDPDYRSLEAVLGPDEIESLESTADACGCTPAMVFMACLAAVRARRAGRGSVELHVPAATDLSLISAADRFAGLKLDSAYEHSLRESLESARAEALRLLGEAGDAQIAPAAPAADSGLQSAGQTRGQARNQARNQGGISRPPIFELLVEMSPAPDVSSNNAAAELLEFDARSSLHQQRISVAAHKSGWRLRCEYSGHIFDAADVELFLEELRGCIAAAAKLDMAQKLPSPPISAGENALLHRWNCAISEERSGDESLLHERVLRQCRLHADAPAVRDGKNTLSYAGLETQSRQLAAALQAAGAGAGMHVGVQVRRSADLVTALLAVLRCGAAYVPVDPAYPAERREFLLRDAAVELLVLDDAADEHIPAGIKTIQVSARHDAALQPVHVDPAGTAYIIYTSGSTGRPKGAIISHHNVTRLFDVCAGPLGLVGTDVWSWFHSASFDFSVWEIWGALCHGALLSIVPPPLARDPRAFYRFLLDEGVTVLSQTPPAFAELLNHEPADASADVIEPRVVVFGGEALPPATLWRWYAARPRRRTAMVNMYGITETTVHVTLNMLRPFDALRSHVSIGLPLADLGLALLDENLEPVAFGASGEIYVYGAGLAQGYLGRPGLTAERFLPLPESLAAGLRRRGEKNPGYRMYRSGDLGRRTALGKIDHLGRSDKQIKVRGFRIEPAEIEQRIDAHPAVQQSLVLNIGEGAEAVLAAWVRPVGTPPDAAALREFLSASLPPHMLPNIVIPLAEFPLTVNGKVDLARLPKQSGDVSGGAASDAAGESVLDFVRGLWSRVLGRDERIASDEEFFSIGGQSLSATRVTSAIAERYGIQLGVSDMFQAPRLGELVEHVEELIAEARPTETTFHDRREAEIAALMAELLNTNGIGPEDDFLSLGGHSLLMTRLASRLADRFGVRPPVEAIFTHATPRALAALLRTTASAAAEQGAAPTSVAPDGVRLPAASPGQQRLWVLQRLLPKAARAYVVPVWLDIEGQFDIEVFNAAWRSMLARHEVLRATFPEIDGIPGLAVAPPPSDVEIELTDLSARTAAERETALRDITAAQLNIEFDLATGPLSVVRVLRLDAERYRVLLTFHHIIIDAWSREILVNDLLRVYESLAAGTAVAPPPQFHYSDIVRRQHAASARGAYDAAVKYWLDKLADMPALMDIPGDRPRPAAPSFSGSAVYFRLDVETSAALRGLARAESCTMYVLLLTVFKSLLARYTMRDDIVVGSPVANRNMTGSQDVVGYLLNTLVLRSRIDQGKSFRALLRAEHANTLEAFAHQDAPFEQLVKHLESGRDRSHAPLVQVMFFLHYPQAVHMPAGLRVSLGETELSTAKFDLTLGIDDPGAGAELSGGLEYNSDIFDAASIELMVARFLSLCRAVLHAPDSAVGDLQLEAPQPVAAREFFAFDDFLFRQFERRARERGGRTALRHRGLGLSYADLAADARSIGAALIARGAGPDKLVGLYMRRGFALPAAILGIHMSGAAYVPLDPDYPADRLRFMASDSGLFLVLHSGEENAPQFEAPTLAVDELLAAGRNLPAPQVKQLDPDNLAYIIYTSGSTGRPKGVGVTHANAVRLFRAARSLFNFGGDDVWTMFHSYAFDFSVWEMWGALIHGGSLVIVPRATARDPQAFYRLLRDESVTVLNQTPSAFLQLLRTAAEAARGGAQEMLNTLRLVIFGGEALQTAALKPWFDMYPEDRPQLYNMFGITETTVHVTARRITRADCERGGSPIGRPLADLGLTVLDERGHPAPSGIPGELYVRGAGLARAYLGRPALTAQRFVPAPDGERMYRTGDIALRRRDGDIEYLRRRDFQVQLRGYRIELGEIEHALTGHADIAECRVLLVTDEGRPRLVAYFVARRELNKDELREYLRSRLPAYMLPSAFAPLERMPLTPTGKLDRRALPAAPRGGDVKHLASQQAEIIAGLMANILGTESVGVHDDFFALGGHSLLVTQLAASIRAGLGRAPLLADMFEHPSAAAMAGLLNTTETRAQLPALEMSSRSAEDQFPRTVAAAFGQERIWVLLRLAPQIHRAYLVPLYLDIEGEFDPQTMVAAWRAVVARHEVLRTVYPTHDSGRVQSPDEESPAGEVKAEVVGIEAGLNDEQREAALARLTQAAAEVRLDERRGPLWHFSIVCVHARRHRLLLTVHHIAVDAWSNHLLFNDLLNNYELLQTGRAPSPAPEWPTFGDFAAWQRRLLNEGFLAPSLEYWKQTLNAAPPLLELPADRPRPPRQSYRGGVSPFAFDAAESDAIRRLAQREGVTVFILLLTAFKCLLARYAMREDIIVGTPIANRGRPESHGIVGFLLNMLALRTRMSGGQTFRELLRRVRRTVLDAHRHQDAPFELLVEELVSERAMSHAPLVQIVFVLQHEDELQAPEHWTVRRGETHLPMAKFDLTLGLTDRGAGRALAGGFEFNSDIFDAASIEQFARRLSVFVRAVLEDVELPPREVELLGESELRTALAAGRNAVNPASAGNFLPAILNSARSRPDAPAVEYNGEAVSYGELMQGVERAAATLRRLGFGPERTAAVALPRSADLLTAMLAIFHCGGVYMPLDVDYPAARRNKMLNSAGATLLICGAEQTEVLKDEHRAQRVLGFDELLNNASANGAQHAQAAADVVAGQAAYLIFTSGSTGEPKGVINSYAALTNTIENISAQSGIAAGDRYFSFASTNFDVSLYDFLAPLCRGACLCLADAAQVTPGPPLAQSLIGSRATHAFLTPSAAAALPRDAQFPDLRCLMMGAEAVSADLVKRFDGIDVINLYGPTEAAICSTLYGCTTEDERPPIGRGLTGVETLILDEFMRPVAPGMIGELYIGGAGLARAYAGAPAATALRFVPHPLARQAGERLYRSGDLVRLRRDGALEFHGRRDHQVKLRGFRIELGEIEHELRSMPEVGDACAVIRGTGGDRILAAYAAPAASDAELDAAQLRRSLSEKLPRFMLPDTIVVLDRLPLTINGKLDRAALPAPRREQKMQNDWTELERRIAAVWAEILPQGAPPDADANFFEHGGNSLRAVKLLERLQTGFAPDVQINELFDNTTLRAQAAMLRAHGVRESATETEATARSARGAASNAGGTNDSSDSTDAALRRVEF